MVTANAHPAHEQQVLDLLRQRGEAGLTPLEALNVIGTFRLGARIFNLRKQGHAIKREWLTTDKGARVARYVLGEKAPPASGYFEDSRTKTRTKTCAGCGAQRNELSYYSTPQGKRCYTCVRAES